MSLTFLFAIFGCQIFPIVVGQNTNTVFLAGIIDTTVFDWIPDVFEYTADRINTASISGAVLGVTDATVRQGLSEYGPNGLSLRYELANSKCDAATGVRQYWNVRTQNQVPHGVIGARCSGTSISLLASRNWSVYHSFLRPAMRLNSRPNQSFLYSVEWWHPTTRMANSEPLSNCYAPLVGIESQSWRRILNCKCMLRMYSQSNLTMFVHGL